MIVGGPGAGKSWLALRLSRRLGIPVYCVDDAVHDETGTLRSNPDIDGTVRSWALKPQWIIEGGNSRTYADRARRATVLVLMKPPRWRRVYRVAVRDGLRFSLLYWSWKYDAVFGGKDEALLASAGEGVTTCIIRTDKDAAEWVSRMSRTA
ncbi:hypothetical protein EZI54_05930 [Marinobacter halodurans]|uniref:AAA family ATPase n=1 Tax=Marinobacter halodurans TaxID=2528979 RepID=A0ABY1ZQX5_9GAMM|nr:hypothetical protein [Marinobacter halodurans]TBW57987.1 hypothetical protein EZI54_05930 [Marinobacter halodurans]